MPEELPWHWTGHCRPRRRGLQIGTVQRDLLGAFRSDIRRPTHEGLRISIRVRRQDRLESARDCDAAVAGRFSSVWSRYQRDDTEDRREDFSLRGDLVTMRNNPYQSRQPNIRGNASLRTPQREAYERLCEFAQATGDEREVGIVLPVGCGKPRCICLSPFAFQANRTLVIAPGSGK